METTEAPTSIYQPLDKDRKNIRLLHIQPATHKTDPIQCNLEIVFLDDNNTDNDGPHYEALSYAWGTDFSETPVHVDGHPKTITLNLFQALQHLRRPLQARVVWIDALCIDQSNTAERTHQVGFMRTIYERAVSTTVWMGISTAGDCRLAMRFLERFASDEGLHLDPALQPFVEVENENFSSTSIISGLFALFENPWWSRIWTLQEWVLSRRLIIQHGQFSIDVGSIPQVSNNWRLHWEVRACCSDFLLKHPDLDRIYAGFSQLYVIMQIRSCLKNSWHLDAVALPRLMSMSRKARHAADPRDKIYGMLGLACNMYENAVLVDYTQSTNQVYQSATVQMIQRSKSLEILSSVIHGLAHEESLPSWAPDWRVSWDSGYAHQDWQTWLDCMRELDACKAEPAYLHHTGNGHVQLRGIFFDEVELLCHEKVEYGPGFLDKLLAFASSSSTSIRGGQDGICAAEFWLTMCGSMSIDQAEDKGFYCSRVSAEDLTDSALITRITEWNAKPVAEFRAQHLHDLKVRNFVHMYKVMEIGKRLSITKAGRLAWCPQACRKGDTIAVLAGGRVPYVLRKNEDDTYRFLGDSYVHGVMDGEAVDAMEKEGRDWETIELV